MNLRFLLLFFVAASSPLAHAEPVQIPPGREIDRDLVQAAQTGSLPQVNALLKKGASSKAFHGLALEEAVKSRNPAVVKQLLQGGAPISFRALKRALTQGPVVITKMLISGGANVNQIGRWEKEDFREGFTTPLIISVKYTSNSRPKYEITRLLLRKGAKVDLRLPNGGSVFDEVDTDDALVVLIPHSSSLGPYRKSILRKAMVSHNGDLLAALQKKKMVPAKLSFRQFDFPTKPFAVKAILASGGNPNEHFLGGWKSWTILHEAARDAQLESVRMLLDAGAKINATADYWHDKQQGEGLTGITPAFMAGEMEDHPQDGLNTLQLLLDRGLSPNATDTYNGFPLLSWKAINDRHPVQAIAILLKAGAKLTRKDKQGQTALHLAAINDKPQVVRALLKADHSKKFLEMKDRKGGTALMRAVQIPLDSAGAFNGESKDLGVYLPTISSLVNAGANVFTKDDNGGTLLHALAATPTREATLRIAYLYQKGLKSLDVKDGRGATPLYVACENANVEVASFLFRSGANPDATTVNGSSPRKLVMKPFHMKREVIPKMTAEQKKVNEAYYQILDAASDKRRQQILALFSTKKK